jgi:septum formation protein
LILASASPRRRQLLAEAGYEFDVVIPADSAESVRPGEENPAEIVARRASQKAADVARRVESGIIIGCDTVVECDGQVLGKPVGVDDARRMLETLRGREHRVYSGLCVWTQPQGEARVRVEVTVLFMDPLTDAQIDRYLAGGAWKGKAGAFGYQDGLDWVHVARGSESNVVGLPMELLAEMLAEAGS